MTRYYNKPPKGFDWVLVAFIVAGVVFLISKALA